MKRMRLGRALVLATVVGCACLAPSHVHGQDDPTDLLLGEVRVAWDQLEVGKSYRLV